MQCRVAKVVAPKKEKLAAAEAEYSELMVGLNQKKAELAAVEANLAALNAKLKEMQDQKQQLEFDVDLCSKKLDRATKLIGGLGGEKTRWTEVAEKLGKDYVNLTGDVLLSAGFIAYLGGFVISACSPTPPPPQPVPFYQNHPFAVRLPAPAPALPCPLF